MMGAAYPYNARDSARVGRDGQVAPQQPKTMKERVEELRTRKEQALHAGSRQAVEVQHDKGKLTARERIDSLLDPGSFVETDMLATHRSTAFGMDKRRIPGDGVVTGYGTIGGRRVSSPRTSPSSAAPWARSWPRRSARSWTCH